MILLPTLCLLFLTVAAVENESFSEDVALRTLPDGRVATTFTFNTILEKEAPRDPRTLFDDQDESQHYTLFPLSLGQVLREYAVTELHLTLNAGKWDYDKWGYPSEPDVGSGASLWTWMADGAPNSIDARWSGLRNALAGLFCASLGTLDEQRTTSPVIPFAPEGSLPDWGIPHRLRHASLASEHVCTENLTPFLKLLPCKGLSGIASLLNPHRLFDADWHGMGIHVLWDPAVGVQVRMTFQTVTNPLRAGNIRKEDWSFRSLFDRRIERVCPVASSSQVSVGLPSRGMYNLKPEPHHITDNMGHYDLTKDFEPMDVSIKWKNAFEYLLEPITPHPMPISFRRMLHGNSQDRGQLVVTLDNHLDNAIDILYLETMPWMVQFYLHTMTVEHNGSVDNTLLSNLSYIPPVPHAQPATFQVIVTLPAQAHIKLSIDVTKAFLRYTEHPPDAQRGWDLPPAVFMPLDASPLDAKNETLTTYPRGKRIYSSPMLVDLATPDFSMPYNVIIFSCSLVAFLFGTIFNLLTRKWVVLKLDGEKEKEE
ncbi:GPI transamidase component GPI16 [Cylindrobasidium torrendii FP15055 ss-10]|uniref:GPI transamidase component GPI16 n=1 Tax=Cylindrobasidium torrendii FP15055 ss-10 TaxID=1314674 RepID=A0A0D7BR04_9AGAR|nr:GPI transamidase component GPI16 [Cylindrobasidium torrendii FP15055 ss-10]